MASPESLLRLEQSPTCCSTRRPGHWCPWETAALAEARFLHRPVLLLVGYAARHWCHVMAHESFEDPDTAALMNRGFVNIRVDREEHAEHGHRRLRDTPVHNAEPASGLSGGGGYGCQLMSMMKKASFGVGFHRSSRRAP